MFEFYKKRDFGELVGDTFMFLKLYGRNYFKNYLVINGLFLILLLILIVVGFRDFFSMFLGSNVSGTENYFENYVEENIVMMGMIIGIIFLLSLAISVINYSFPALYMKRLSETGNPNIKIDELLSDLKDNAKRIFFLFLGISFVVFPLVLMAILVSYLLMLLLIGFLILFFIMPILLNIINFLLFDYLHTNKSFFNSLNYSIQSQFLYTTSYWQPSPFWKYWLSTVAIYFIVQTISTIFTIIPVFLLIGGMLTIPQQGGEEEFLKNFMIIFFVFYVVAIFVSLILSNILYIHSGLMYYDSRTDLHQHKDLTEIDSIGKNEF